VRGLPPTASLGFLRATIGVLKASPINMDITSIVATVTFSDGSTKSFEAKEAAVLSESDTAATAHANSRVISQKAVCFIRRRRLAQTLKDQVARSITLVRPIELDREILRDTRLIA
jgi:hypothetical protein